MKIHYTDKFVKIYETFNEQKYIKCPTHENVLNVEYMKYYQAFIA